MNALEEVTLKARVAELEKENSKLRKDSYDLGYILHVLNNIPKYSALLPPETIGESAETDRFRLPLRNGADVIASQLKADLCSDDEKIGLHVMFQGVKSKSQYYLTSSAFRNLPTEILVRSMAIECIDSLKKGLS